MEHGITEVSTEQVSLEDFYETSVESLGIPEKERKLYRVFVEEKKPVIEHLWSTFRAEQASRTKDDWQEIVSHFCIIEHKNNPNREDKNTNEEDNDYDCRSTDAGVWMRLE